jgi:hypothetical protein
MLRGLFLCGTRNRRRQSRALAQHGRISSDGEPLSAERYEEITSSPIITTRSLPDCLAIYMR